MPKYYVKHLAPPTICTRFSPEREAVPFKLTLAAEHTHEPRTEVFNKPSGDVAKHYRLKDVVHISDTDFKTIQSAIHEAARAELDTSKAFQAQDQVILTALCREVSAHYPVLSRFTDHWVTKDFLKMYLKNTSSRARYKGLGKRKTR